MEGPERYQNRYRVPSARRRNWDYGAEAAYFITICCHGRRHFFGRIDGGVMHLNEVGQIAHDCWAALPDHFAHLTLDAFVVMPNHVHGILIIDRQGEADAPDPDSPGAGAPVQTGHALSLSPTPWAFPSAPWA
ncbi:MAG: hypothetical protein WBA12_03165, partial [Catalinimonas sp.]